MSTFNPSDGPGITFDEPPSDGPKGFLFVPAGGDVHVNDQFGVVVRGINDSTVTLTGVVYRFTIQSSSGGGMALPVGLAGTVSTLSGQDPVTETATGLSIQLPATADHSLAPGDTFK